MEFTTLITKLFNFNVYQSHFYMIWRKIYSEIKAATTSTSVVLHLIISVPFRRGKEHTSITIINIVTLCF